MGDGIGVENVDKSVEIWVRIEGRRANSSGSLYKANSCGSVAERT